MRIRELKAEARNALKGNLLKIALPLFFISVLTYAFSMGINYLIWYIKEPMIKFGASLMLYIVMFLFLNILQFGVVIRTIKISRNEESHYFRDTFFKENVKSSFSVFWGLTKKYALWIILIFLPVIFTATTFANSFEINSLPPGELGSMQSIDTTATTIMRWLSSMIAYVAMVMLIVVTYRYMLTYYLKYDYPDKSTKELLEKSRMMMRGNKAKALTITFTLIGWFLLFLIVVTIISLILNSIWQPVFFYYTTISTVPFWATVLSNCFIYFLSSLLVSYLNMTNYQLYMEQKPLELYNDGYLKPETNAKKYIWIVIGVFILIFIIYSLYEKFYL